MSKAFFRTGMDPKLETAETDRFGQMLFFIFFSLCDSFFKMSRLVVIATGKVAFYFFLQSSFALNGSGSTKNKLNMNKKKLKLNKLCIISLGKWRQSKQNLFGLNLVKTTTDSRLMRKIWPITKYLSILATVPVPITLTYLKSLTLPVEILLLQLKRELFQIFRNF